MRIGFRGLGAASLTVALLWMSACGGGEDDAGAGGGGDQAACKPAAEGEKVTLSYTSWVPGFDKTVALWNKENPDIQVKYRNVPAGDQGTYQNYSNQLKAGTAGDMGFLEYEALPNFAVQGGLQDVSTCPGVKEEGGKFLDWTWSQVAVGQPGKVFAIPQDQGPMGLYYRKDLFKRAGIPVPKTWDDFYEAAKKVKADGGRITNFAATGNYIAGLAWQSGAKWFGLEGSSWTVDLTAPETMRVAEYWQKMLDEDLVTTYAPFGDEQFKAWNNGNLWTVIGAAWTAKHVETNAPKGAGKWAVAPLPQWKAGDTNAGNWGGATIAIFKGTKHPAEAAQFALWANSDPDALALNNKNGGQYPATKAATEQVPALAGGVDYFGGQNIWNEFTAAAENVDSSWQWGPVMVSTFAEITNGGGAAINGKGTLSDALRSAQQKTVETMKAQSLAVKE